MTDPKCHCGKPAAHEHHTMPVVVGGVGHPFRHAFEPVEEPEPEAEQELPLAWEGRTYSGTRFNVRLSDLLALLPKLSTEQRMAIAYALSSAWKEVIEGIEQERDAAISRANSLQHDVDELGDEVAGAATLLRELTAATGERDAAIARAESAERKHSATMYAGLAAERRVIEYGLRELADRIESGEVEIP